MLSEKADGKMAKWAKEETVEEAIIRVRVAKYERDKGHMRRERFFIEYMGPSTNAIYAGQHWTKRAKEADKAHKAVKALDTDLFLNPVKLMFTPQVGKGGRERDCSNYSYTCKMIEDGLVKQGILSGDEADKVVRFAINRPVINRKAPSGLWIVIEETCLEHSM